MITMCPRTVCTQNPCLLSAEFSLVSEGVQRMRASVTRWLMALVSFSKPTVVHVD